MAPRNNRSGARDKNTSDGRGAKRGTPKPGSGAKSSRSKRGPTSGTSDSRRSQAKKARGANDRGRDGAHRNRDSSGGRTGSSSRKPSKTSARSKSSGKSTSNKGLGGTQVEGRHAVRELLLADRRKVTEIVMAHDMDAAPILSDIVDLAREKRVIVREVSRKKHDAEAHTEGSQGVIAHAEQLGQKSLDELTRPTRTGLQPFLIAVDGVTDPRNLGAIIRTAECAGVTGLILPRHRSVHITPTVTKTAAGAIEHVDMCVVGGLAATVTELQRASVRVLGLDAGGDNSIHSLEMANEPVCLVIGSEGAGLSRLVAKRCDQLVSIPLRGDLSSLNAATAAALGMFEIVRNRSY